MRRILVWLVFLLLLVAVAGAALYVIAGRGAPPAITITRPDRAVGQTGELEVIIDAPDARLSELTITLDQNGERTPLFSLDATQSADVSQPEPNRLRIARPIGKASVPSLRAGPARLLVAATRPGFLNLRQLSSASEKAFQVQLDPPRIAVVSTHHYVNHGGSELVIYRVTPADAWSGVRVGDAEYPGYPAAGAGVAGADPTLKAAFFALAHDQDPSARMAVVARDAAGNEASAEFVDRVFPKTFKKSRIELDDRFLNRVVPEIVARTPEFKDAGAEVVPAFLRINGDLRRQNAARIAALTAAPSPSRLWTGPFVQMGNSQVEANFADHRTYVYGGKEIDQQVHLGFDLASTARAPVLAANDGIVLYAEWLGIYGNCVLVDHGMGIASLYGHLTSFDVRAGDKVTRGQRLGQSGMTGLAGGDHLHFTMLVHGRAVNPVEWWDPHWIADRVDRKLREAGS
jgi:murein DD-endopeptidase MepM/ murein hydrolase activator NlpD